MHTHPDPSRHRPACWATVTALSLASALIISLAGCAATPAGIQGAEAFVKDSAPFLLTGPRDTAEAARCFEEQATFLPLSEFSRDSGMGEFTYRLRLIGLWFEQVRITPQAGGSQAELRVAPNLDAKWLTRLERDRLAPLRRCLAG